MRLPLFLCAAIVTAVFAVGSPAGAADASCQDTAVVDVLPLHAPIGVHHTVDLVLLPDFVLNRLVPHSLSFHVDMPAGTLDLPGGDDSLGAQFKAPAVGSYTATASWQLQSCDDPSVIVDGKAPAKPFQIYRERRPVARFKATLIPNRASTKAPIFAVDAACPADTIGVTEPLQLTVYYEVGNRRPTHSSPHSTQTLPKGCNGPPGPSPKSKNFRWGVTRGGTIGVLPGYTVRVLGQLESGRRIVGETRVRFQPRGNSEAFARDGDGPCVGGCVKRIFKY